MVGGIGYRFIFIGTIARPCNPCRGVKSQCFQNFCAGAMGCTYLLYKLCVPCRGIIGASVNEPLCSDLNVKFICLSVCLSWMDRHLTRKSLLALILRGLCHALIQKPLES